MKIHCCECDIDSTVDACRKDSHHCIEHRDAFTCRCLICGKAGIPIVSYQPKNAPEKSKNVFEVSENEVCHGK